MDKYGPFKRTDYRVIVGNLSTRVSWQVRAMLPFSVPLNDSQKFLLLLNTRVMRIVPLGVLRTPEILFRGESRGKTKSCGSLIPIHTNRVGE